MEGVMVFDGSDIRQLVGSEEGLATYVEHEFHEHDADNDGTLSVQELQPTIEDIGDALGLPARGFSPNSENVDSQVSNGFSDVKQEDVTKSQFKEGFSSILLTAVADLQRDSVVILRIDGEDLEEFIRGSTFEQEVKAMYSQMDSTAMSLCELIDLAMGRLTVDHGMPPPFDSWVIENITQPALLSVSANCLKRPVSQETFLLEFKNFLQSVTQRLKENPVIVAHGEHTFDGSGINRLLFNDHELDTLLDAAWSNLSKDHDRKASTEILLSVLDSISPSAGLPRFGVAEQVDSIVRDTLRIFNVADEVTKIEEFKSLIKEILGSIMLQLEQSPVFYTSNTVVHENITSSNLLMASPLLSSTQPHSE